MDDLTDEESELLELGAVAFDALTEKDSEFEKRHEAELSKMRNAFCAFCRSCKPATAC